MDTLPAVRAALNELYVLKSIDILINSIWKPPPPLFNFPYPSHCLPYFPFPSLLTGNTTTVFNLSNTVFDFIQHYFINSNLRFKTELTPKIFPCQLSYQKLFRQLIKNSSFHFVAETIFKIILYQ